MPRVKESVDPDKWFSCAIDVMTPVFGMRESGYHGAENDSRGEAVVIAGITRFISAFNKFLTGMSWMTLFHRCHLCTMIWLLYEQQLLSLRTFTVTHIVFILYGICEWNYCSNSPSIIMTTLLQTVSTTTITTANIIESGQRKFYPDVFLGWLYHLKSRVREIQHSIEI